MKIRVLQPRTVKCGLVHIFFCYEDLIVAHIAIQEANHLVTQCAIDQQIGNGHRVLVLRSSSVEVSKVHAYSYLPRVLLLDQDDVRNPICKATWLYEPSLQQPVHLLLHPSNNFWLEVLGSLFIWSKNGFNR
jgi:hypothetical protein